MPERDAVEIAEHGDQIEAVNALFCEREIINNKNIIKKLMFFLSDVNHTKKDVVQSALNIIIDITSGDI
ncbi:hypothetical protein ACP8YK_24450 [Escherichia coli]